MRWIRRGGGRCSRSAATARRRGARSRTRRYRVPRSSAPWRELAGLDALEQNWTAAAEHARRAVAADPGDAYAWQLLATAEYLSHDDLAALAAWNHAGEPRVDLVDVKGLERTRYLVIADAIGVRPRQVLTPDALRLAERRVRAVPAIAFARVTFRPGENGKATDRRGRPRTQPGADQLRLVGWHRPSRRDRPRDWNVVRQSQRRRRRA